MNDNKNILDKIMNDYDRRDNVSPIGVSNQPIIVPTDDLVQKSINRVQNLQSFDKDFWDSYAKYNVFLSSNKSQKDLDRERAENQSNIEKFNRFIGQSLGNEVVLGTVRGLFDMIDAAVNATKAINAAVTGNTDNLINDYTNPISKWITDQQDKLRTRLEIYEKDPNQSWAVNDFGWWMNNATSILSSVSLLIPSTGVVKGASYLGKLTKALRNVDKTLDISKQLSEANKAVKALNPTKWGQRAELFSSAILSRTMENYQEGRDVYEQVYNSTLDTLNNMPEVQKNYFLENNPEYIDKSNEEIAEDIASKKGTNTFLSDYSLLLFDVMQLKSLNNFWKNAKRGSTVELRQANKEAINNLVKKTTDNSTEESLKLTFKDRIEDWAKYSIKHPLDSPFMSELSEGIEEGYQGITSSVNIDNADALLNNSTERSAISYLSDPEVWEQAFWGWIGGVAFQGLGSGLGKLSRKVKAETNKNNMTKEEYNLTLLGEEESRKNEINDRLNLLEQYKNKIDLINQNVNIYKQTSNGKYFEFSSESEKELAKRKLTEELITEMVINAANNGNYELLREFVTDDNFDKWFTENNIDTSLSKQFIGKMDEIASQYEDAIVKIQNSTNIRNADVARLAAKQIVRQKQTTKYNDDILGIELNELNNDTEFITLSTKANDRIIYDSAKVLLNQLDEESSYLKTINSNGFKPFTKMINGKPVRVREILSKEALDERLKEINKKKKFILDYVKNNTSFGTLEDIKELTNIDFNSVLNEIYTKFNNFYESINNDQITDFNSLSTNIKNKYSKYIQQSIINDYSKSTIPNNKQQYKEIYDEFDGFLDGIVNLKMDNAFNHIKDYIKNQDDVNTALENLINETNISEDLINDLRILKLGSKTSSRYTRNLINLVDSIDKENKEEISRPENVTSGDKEIDSATKRNVDNNTPSSTGVETKATEDIIQSNTEINNNNENNNINNDNTSSPVGGNRTEPRPGFQFIEVINPDGTKTKEEIPIDEFNNDTPSESESKFIEQEAEVFSNRLGYGTEAKIDIDKIGQEFNGMLQNPETKERTLDAINKGFGSKELNDVIDELVDYVIINTGASLEEAFYAVKTAIKLRIEQLNNYNKFKDEKTKQNAIRLINELATKSIVDFDLEGNPSIIESISNEDYVEKASELIAMLYNNNSIKDSNNIIEIDINDAFRELLKYCKENNLSIDDAKAIYYNFRKIIIENTNKSGNLNTNLGNIKFTNYDLFLEDENDFFQSLMDAYTKVDNVDNKYHVKVSNGLQVGDNVIIKNNKTISEVISRNIGKKAIIRFNGNMETTKSAVIVINDEKLGEVEIGYIPFVTLSEDNNTIKLQTADNVLSEDAKSNQWRMVITKNSDDSYSLNIDDIIENILNDNEEIYEFLRKYALRYKYGIGKDITKEELLNFYNSNIIQKLIDSKNGYYKTIPNEELTDEQRASLVANSITNILFYNRNATVNDNKIALQIYYDNFKQKVYDNYRTTKTIENNLRNSQNGVIQITLDSVANRKLILDDDERGINSIKLDSSKQTIVFVNQEGKIQTENGTEDIENVPGFNLGTMGFLIENYEGNPFIATFTSVNIISESNPKLWGAIEKELRDSLNNYYNAKTREDIDKYFLELKDVLTELINTDKDGIFKGFKVYYNEDRQCINVTNGNNSKANNIVFYKFSNYLKYNEKGDKKFRTPDGKIVDFSSISDDEYLRYITKTTIFRENGTGPITQYMGNFNVLINRIINQVKDTLTFNNTAFAIRNNNQNNAGTNKYFYKENGKLKIKVGSFEETYDNFGDLVLKNNAFNTRQGVTSDGSYFKLDGVTNSIFFNVDMITEPEDNSVIVENDIKSSTLEKPVKTETLLSNLGYARSDIDFLLNGEMPLIPIEIYYDTNDKTDRRAYTQAKTNKIIFTPKGVEYIKLNNYELPRILVHENIHATINGSNFFSGKIGTTRINYTLETLRQFEEHINNDTSNTPEIQALKAFLNNFKNVHKLLYESNTRNSKEKLANEWMAEVFSQSALANYLNQIEYKEDNIKLIGEEQQKETLFSKLLNLIIKLFDNINKNTILDQLIRISKLSPNSSKKTKTNTKSGNKSSRNKNKNTYNEPILFPLEEHNTENQYGTEDVESDINTDEIDNNDKSNINTDEIITEDDILEDEDEDLFDIDETDNLASMVDPVTKEDLFKESNTANQVGNLIKSDSMSDFVRSFDPKYRAEMAEELASNRIKYYCQ